MAYDFSKLTLHQFHTFKTSLGYLAVLQARPSRNWGGGGVEKYPTCCLETPLRDRLHFLLKKREAVPHGSAMITVQREDGVLAETLNLAEE